MLYLSKYIGKFGVGSNTAFNSEFPANATQIAEGVLSSAQILALFTTPITLIAAPGAGKYISVDEIVFRLNFGTTQYTGANALEVRYTDGSGVKVTGDLASACIDSASSRADKVIGVAAAVAVANAPIVAAVPTANPAAGDGTISYSIIYRVVTLP